MERVTPNSTGNEAKPCDHLARCAELIAAMDAVGPEGQWCQYEWTRRYDVLASEAVAYVRAELARRDEAEPVAWQMRSIDHADVDYLVWKFQSDLGEANRKALSDRYEFRPLYAAPKRDEAAGVVDGVWMYRYGIRNSIPTHWSDWARIVPDQIEDWKTSHRESGIPFEVRQFFPAATAPKGGDNDKLREALMKLRLRFHFMGMPQEPFWCPDGKWIPDWRYELQFMENALFGSKITAHENPKDTKAAMEVVPKGGEGFVVVPREPSATILEAMRVTMGCTSYELSLAIKVYAALLAAAAPPSAGEENV